jgi:DNA (cytosine-5)-methyltransferase 1
MYNENEPFAISWLERLMERNLIQKGTIDGRSINDLTAADCGPTSHFFAGIGGWAYALQLAGWNPARPVWTGSAPCQPFSVAGAGSGFSDSRHLWPIWYELIKECKPSVIFGEQTASKLGREWLAGVRSDLETLGYAVGAADLCAASVNAPHRRQRLYWVAYTGHGGDRGWDGFRDSASGIIGAERENQGGGQGRIDQSRLGALDVPTDGSSVRRGTDGMVNTLRGGASNPDSQTEQGRNGSDNGVFGPASESNFWDNFNLAYCREIDGNTRVRRIESGTLPVVDGIPNRVGRIRGYGNSIVPQLAATFIRSFLEAEGELFA